MAVKGLTHHLMFTEDCAKMKLKKTRRRLGSGWRGEGELEGGGGHRNHNDRISVNRRRTAKSLALTGLKTGEF